MLIIFVLNNVFSPSDVISETESDNQQRQIHQEAHRVFRSRRHISEDLENEHMEPRDLDNVSENNIYIILQWPTVMHCSHTIARQHHYGCIAVLIFVSVVLGAHHRRGT